MSEEKTGHAVKSVTIVSRLEAEAVVSKLRDLIEVNGQASVAEFYQLVGIEETYLDSQWGWTDLRDARSTNTGEGWALFIPKPELLYQTAVESSVNSILHRLDLAKNHVKKHRNLYMVGAASLTVGVLVGAAIVSTRGITITGDSNTIITSHA